MERDVVAPERKICIYNLNSSPLQAAVNSNLIRKAACLFCLYLPYIITY